MASTGSAGVPISTDGGRVRVGGGSDIVPSSRGPSAGLRAKAAFDRVLAAGAMVVAAPVLALVALAVRLDSPGPVLFRQPRYGLGGQVVMITKFRTMRAESTDIVGARQATKGDVRVTRTGRFLRRTCLDELPQFWDVLMGRMSFVGPRPHPVGMTIEGRLAEDVIEHYWDRLRMRPGITGLAQVSGNRGPVPDIPTGQARIDMDNAYIDGWTFWRDIAILLRTLSVPFRKGSY